MRADSGGQLDTTRKECPSPANAPPPPPPPPSREESAVARADEGSATEDRGHEEDAALASVLQRRREELKADLDAVVENARGADNAEASARG